MKLMKQEQATRIEAFFDGEVLRPEGPVPLEPNTHVRLILELGTSSASEPTSFLKVARSLQLEGPADWSEKVDTYLYGDKPET